MPPPIRWFDTHVHLDRYGDSAGVAMLARAAEAGVAGMLAVSTSVTSSQRTAALSTPVWKAVGQHPIRAGEAPESLVRHLRRIATLPGVAAVGETGFDASGPDWPAQHTSFAAQAGLAREMGLALVLHIDGAGAWQQLTSVDELLDGLRVVRHYFRGDQREADWHASRGHYVSFGRPLLRDRALQAIAAGYPAELLLIETDSYPLPGRTTEPKDLVPVGECLAGLRGWSIETCAERLWANTVQALALDDSPAAPGPR